MLDIRQVLDKMLQVQAHGGSGVSVGTITEYAGTFPPDGWVLCDGRTLSRTVYAELFDEIGTTWGAGDGSTTFNIPDLRNKFSVGTGGLYSLTNTGGNKDLVVPYHNHSVAAVTSGNQSANHTHTRGTMNITGGFAPWTEGKGADTTQEQGAFYSVASTQYGWGTTTGRDADNEYMYFDASRAWTGATSTESANHNHTIPSHSTEYAGTSGNLTNANLPPYLAINFIIFTGVFQTLTAQTTWTLLEDRIQNSQLNIAVPSFFDDLITIDDDIKIKINQNVTTGVDYNLNAALTNLGWTDLINNSEITFKGILSRMARGGAIAGTIMEYAGIFPPDGWVVCDGRALSRTVYEELFDAIGTTFGSGDGSTTFNIPDFRGRVATGVGTCDGVTYTLGQKKSAGIPNITGYIKSSNSSVYQSAWENDGSVTKGGVFNTSTWATRNGFPDSSGNYSSIAQLNFDASQSNSHYGASTTVQPNTTVINYIIFTGVYQTIAAATTWTSLQDRISNSQLNIPVITNFDNKIHFNISASTDLTHIPNDNEIVIETGDGSRTISSWLWREKYAASNWGIFHDNSTNIIHFVGNSTSQLSVDLNNGQLNGPTDTLYLPFKIVRTAANLNNYTTTGWYIMAAGADTNYATSSGNHGVLFVCFDLGTPFQIFWGDSSIARARKRYYTKSTGAWSAWFDF